MCKEPTRQAVFHDERHIFCSVRSFLAHYQICFCEFDSQKQLVDITFFTDLGV